MIVLFIGDIVGKPGRKAIEAVVPGLVKQYSVDFVVANGENAAGGFGLTPDISDKLRAAGIHGITLGNHLYDQKEADELLENERLLARPANFPPGNPGNGYFVLEGLSGTLAVVSLQGRVFMTPIDCPFRVADKIVEELRSTTKAILIDFHAEATSEKQALGIYLDGRVSAVLGTHTHVQTADERILKGGTGFITDVGMTGPHESVIGMEPSAPISKMISARRARFEVAEGDVRFCAVLLDIDRETGQCKKIERMMINVP